MVSISVVQQKQDEIERLAEQLEKEKERYEEAVKEASDINEEIRIAEERMQHALAEKEKM